MEVTEPTSPQAEEPSPLTPPPPPVDLPQQAEQKKELGNAAFRLKKFQDAIDRYTEAIGADATDQSHERALDTVTICLQS